MQTNNATTTALELGFKLFHDEKRGTLRVSQLHVRGEEHIAFECRADTGLLCVSGLSDLFFSRLSRMVAEGILEYVPELETYRLRSTGCGPTAMANHRARVLATRAWRWWCAPATTGRFTSARSWACS